MTNRKITEFTELTSPGDSDVLPIIDGSESGADKNKKITLGNILSKAPDGNSLSPSFSWKNDGNTGMYRAGTDSIGFTTGGTLGLTISSSQEVTFEADITAKGDIVSNKTGAKIRPNTADGSDNKSIYLCGGGDLASTRGSVVAVTGNELDDGNLWLIAGQSDGEIKFVSADTSDAMIIDKNGNVGIGTGVLKLTKQGADNYIRVGAGQNVNDHAYIDLVGDSTYTSYGLRLIRNASGANTSSSLLHRGTGDLQITAQDAADITFNTGNTEKAVITSDGDVGIGTTNPTEALEIRGNYIKIDNNAAASGGIIIDVGESAGAVKTAQIFLRDRGTDKFAIRKNSSNKFDIYNYATSSPSITIDDNGNVGILDTDPNAPLTIKGGALAANVTIGGRDIQTNVDLKTTSWRGGVLVRNMNNYREEDTEAAFMAYDPYDTTADAYSFRVARGATLADTCWIKNSGKAYFASDVGIGTSSPSEALDVTGNIVASGTITGSSDIAYKKDIQPLSNALEKVTQLLGINFTYKSNNEKSMGLVAQDVEKIFPELIRGEEGKKSLNYMGLTGALIEAIKELSVKIEKLETKNQYKP